MIVGNGGAGKSTVAGRLGELLDLPVVHLDQEYWQEGWVPSDRDAWRVRCGELTGAEFWIIDGNYSSTYPERIERADLIVFLDLPRRVTIPSAIRRWLRWRGTTRPSMATGCPEQMSPDFVSWMWAYPREGRTSVLNGVAAAAATDRLVRLRSRRSIARWLDDLTQSVRAG